MKKTTKKKMSIEDIALSMSRGFKRVESLIEKKIDGLAISTAKGFEGVDEKIDNSIDLIDKLAISTLNNFERIESKMATKDVLEVMLKEINAIHGDTKSFRDNISTLYTDHVGYDKKISNLTVRVEKLEVKSK